jgi:hypothetical protein
VSLKNFQLFIIPQTGDRPQQTKYKHTEFHAVGGSDVNFSIAFFHTAVQQRRGNQSRYCADDGAKDKCFGFVHGLFPLKRGIGSFYAEYAFNAGLNIGYEKYRLDSRFCSAPGVRSRPMDMVLRQAGVVRGNIEQFRQQID